MKKESKAITVTLKEARAWYRSGNKTLEQLGIIRLYNEDEGNIKFENILYGELEEISKEQFLTKIQEGVSKHIQEYL